MRVRRQRVLGEGFEARELLRARAEGSVPGAFQDFQINQRGELPRRTLMESIPQVRPGPEVTPAGFDRNRILGMLDLATSQIGRSIQFGAAINGQSAPLIQAQASDERARQLTINLSVEPLTAGLDRDIVALVSWGAGGMVVADVELDFMNGVTFSLICSFLRITARNDAVATPTPAFVVGAFFGYEPRPGISRGPQRTTKIGAVTVATPVAFAIPRFATSFSFVRTPLTAAITLTPQDGLGNAMGAIPIAAGADASQNIYPIPGDASSILVTAAAADTVDGRFVFGLSL